MSLRFSIDGPAFPEQLVDALLEGEVVFLCGAGISTPALPMFAELVKSCIARLGLEKNSSELESFGRGQYEEVLGSVSRRTVDSGDVSRKVVNILQERSEGADLSRHHTILKLSRNLDNRPTVITTNFDTMLERALEEEEGIGRAQKLSFAGQDLPLPGSSEFAGIIHLHGRMADETIGLKQTPMVLTSAEYGDAYMRSGWASRFLFDLCRCKTVVLVGYSASDAPVRYFLNVLETDRTRFPDVYPVYAFAPVKSQNDPDSRWSTLAVRPIPYEFTKDESTNNEDHSSLWRDLEKLAELVMRPRATRQAWAKCILEKPQETAEPEELDRIVWLLKGRRDLFATVINAIEDPQWFIFLTSQEVWDQRDASWIIATWIAKELTSSERFQHAIYWLEKLGTSFSESLNQMLEANQALPILWEQAWCILVASQPKTKSNPTLKAYAITNSVRNPAVLNKKLYDAIELITPAFRLTSPYRAATNPPQRISDIFGFEWVVDEQYEIQDLIDALVEAENSVRIFELASAQLHKFINLSVDLGGIDQDYDINDYAVPSVEPHNQNENHDGPIFLTQLLARLLPLSAKQSSCTTRAIAESWRDMPGALGARLWMHALRDHNLYTDDEAIMGVYETSLEAFWNIRRELPLVLQNRSANASSELLSRIESRILTEGAVYYARFEMENNGIDWREHARDMAVWIRLNMLNSAGVLSDIGKSELAAIKIRREHLDRDVEDQDFFGSYSYGVHTIDGDAQPLIDATVTERFKVAQEVMSNPDLRAQLGWGVYCRSDPEGAFDTLSQAVPAENNAKLWNTFFNSISLPQGEDDTGRNELFIKALKFIDSASDLFFVKVIRSITLLYSNSSHQLRIRNPEWWPRLFLIAMKRNTKVLDPACDFYYEATNSPGGQLTHVLLADIERLRQTGKAIEPNFMECLKQAATANGQEGAFSRVVLIRHATFVLSIEDQEISDILDRSLDGDSVEAVALRSVLVNLAENSVLISRHFSRHILKGVIEIKVRGVGARTAAAKIIFPALALLENEKNTDGWGITLEQIDFALKMGPPTLRIGASMILKQLMFRRGVDGSLVWKKSVGPLLSRWSRDRDLCEKELTHNFAEIAVASADAFPEALQMILPYLTVQQSYGSLSTLTSSGIPEIFPGETLVLLWRLFGPGCRVVPYEIPKLLDRLIKVKPEIEKDRRLQWLDLNGLRYE